MQTAHLEAEPRVNRLAEMYPAIGSVVGTSGPVTTNNWSEVDV